MEIVRLGLDDLFDQLDLLASAALGIGLVAGRQAVEEFLAIHLGGRHQAEAPERVRRRLEALTVDVASV